MNNLITESCFQQRKVLILVYIMWNVQRSLFAWRWPYTCTCSLIPDGTHLDPNCLQDVINIILDILMVGKEWKIKAKIKSKDKNTSRRSAIIFSCSSCEFVFCHFICVGKLPRGFCSWIRYDVVMLLFKIPLPSLWVAYWVPMLSIIVPQKWV